MKKLIAITLILVTIHSIEVSNGRKLSWHDAIQVAWQPQESASGLHLNNGKKWKADEATMKNVAALVKAINEPGNSSFKKKEALTGELQAGIDTLISQCRMKGPEHEVLHAWLSQFLQDLNRLKKSSETGYPDSYHKLKKDSEKFYEFFE